MLSGKVFHLPQLKENCLKKYGKLFWWFHVAFGLLHKIQRQLLFYRILRFYTGILQKNWSEYFEKFPEKKLWWNAKSVELRIHQKQSVLTKSYCYSNSINFRLQGPFRTPKCVVYILHVAWKYTYTQSTHSTTNCIDSKRHKDFTLIES